MGSKTASNKVNENKKIKERKMKILGKIIDLRSHLYTGNVGFLFFKILNLVNPQLWTLYRWIYGQLGKLTKNSAKIYSFSFLFSKKILKSSLVLSDFIASFTSSIHTLEKSDWLLFIFIPPIKTGLLNF